MKIKTTRFGDMNIDESRIIVMKKDGILGFEHLEKYVFLVQGKKVPIVWFQSIEDGAIAFVVINPFILKPDYSPILRDINKTLLEIKSPEDMTFMSIVTIHTDPVTITANLRAPIVINPRKKLAKQIILDQPEYPVQYPLQNAELLAAERVCPEGDDITTSLIGKDEIEGTQV